MERACYVWIACKNSTEHEDSDKRAIHQAANALIGRGRCGREQKKKGGKFGLTR